MDTFVSEIFNFEARLNLKYFDKSVLAIKPLILKHKLKKNNRVANTLCLKFIETSTKLNPYPPRGDISTSQKEKSTELRPKASHITSLK